MFRLIPALIPLLFLAACATPPPEPKQPGREDIRLEFAVRHSNLRMVNSALSRNADPDTPGRSGIPVLLVASMLQRADILEALLTHGANVDITDAHGDTALHAAVASKKTDVVELLLKHHANPNAVGKYQRTPILEAARLGRIENVRLLLAANADPTVKDEFGRGILCYAAIAPVNAIPMLELCEKKNVPLAEPEEIDLMCSPLLASMKQGQPETVEYIMKRIGDFSPANRQALGQIAMRVAIENNRLDWVKFLTMHGVRLNQTLPMAFRATKMVNVEGVYKFLARNGAIDKGYTPLIWAAINKRPEIAAYLVESGADVSVLSNEGKTALHYANDTNTRKAIISAMKRVKERKRASGKH